MRNLARFGFTFAVFVLCFFSSVLFSTADIIRFYITSSFAHDVSLESLTSTSTQFSIELDPVIADQGSNGYSIALDTPCAQRDRRGNCLDIDRVPDLCKYLDIYPIDGDQNDAAFRENAESEWFDGAFGHLDNPDKLKTDWGVDMSAPCFEGECPSSYNTARFGAPLSIDLKGKKFSCEILVKYEPPIFMVRGNNDSRVYASPGTDRIVVSAVFGKPQEVVCTKDCYSNVAFLPGIEASRLYKKSDNPFCVNCQDQLWEPYSDVFARDLFLDTTGTKSLYGYDIYTKDVIDTAYGTAGIYGAFESQMNGLKSVGTINDWEALPYDWRFGLDQILNTGKKVGDKIYYGQATSTPFILQEIKHLAETSKTGKVTIVAHSNGGLVTKALMRRLEADGLSTIVDKIIFVAVPQVGTPSAIGGMLHGEDQGIIDWMPAPFLSKNVARTFGENAAGIYNLLPSKGYFDMVKTPVITFTNPLSSAWGNFYGPTVTTQNGLHTFLTDTTMRDKPTESNLQSPDILNSSLLSKAESVHADLDSWQPPAEVKVIEIAGWGRPDTLSAIKYTDPSVYPYKAVSYEPQFVSDGDGTVVTPSALWMSGPNVERYWLNLAEYNDFFRNFNLPRSHVDLFEINSLRNFIHDLITDSSVIPPRYITVLEPKSNPSLKHLQFSLHSPLSLDLFDDQGRHTGISTTTGKVEENIPGTYYKEFGEVKYIFSDEGVSNHVLMSGYAPGTFTFGVSESQGGVEVASTTFANVPTTPQTKVSFDIVNDLASASKLSVDSDSDGVADFALPPKLGAVVTDDTPPTTSIQLTGVKGKNGWYTSDVGLTLTATDTESGVASTTYSLDNGKTWRGYASTTSIIIHNEGTTTVLYYSMDKFGNTEAVTTSLIRIDKSAPEVELLFDPILQKLKVIGRDNLTQSPVIVSDSGRSTVTDDAGHSLVIFYMQPKQKDRRIELKITKLIYDGKVIAIPQTGLKYKWNTKKSGMYTMFAEYSSASGLELEGHFRPDKNQTILMKKPIDIDDRDEDEDCDSRATKEVLKGMAVVGLKTDRGIIKANY
jgi:pimeloyl-ACP methyl ester carboxylesterase